MVLVTPVPDRRTSSCRGCGATAAYCGEYHYDQKEEWGQKETFGLCYNCVSLIYNANDRKPFGEHEVIAFLAGKLHRAAVLTSQGRVVGRCEAINQSLQVQCAMTASHLTDDGRKVCTVHYRKPTGFICDGIPSRHKAIIDLITALAEQDQKFATELAGALTSERSKP